MKTKLLFSTILFLFLNVSFTNAQGCLPASKMNDEKLNKEVAAFLSDFFKNNTVSGSGYLFLLYWMKLEQLFHYQGLDL